MQPISTPTRSVRSVPPAKSTDPGLRDSVRILEAIVTQLNERVEVLEAREFLSRSVVRR